MSKRIYKYGGYNTGDERTDFELTRAECAERQKQNIEIEKMVAQIEREAYNRGRIEIFEHVRAHVADVADETGVYIRADGLLIWLEGMIAEFEGDN